MPEPKSLYEGLFVYWCPRCKVQSSKAFHACRRGPALIPQLDEETQCVRIAVEPKTWHLCMACGTIEPADVWTYWQPNPDEATEEQRPWVPSKPGQEDPMALCPTCGWEHRDTDDGSGFYFGTLAEVKADRAREVIEFAETWADRLAAVADAA